MADIDPDLDLLVGLLKHPSAKALRQIDLHNMRLGQFVKAYASQPAIADLASRSSIREDAVIAELSGLLLSNSEETIRVVDACCGVGTLARRVLQSMGENISRIEYLAIDEQPSSIKTMKSQQREFDGFHSFKTIQRNVCDLDDLPKGSVDLIVLNNALHEIPPRLFPTMFSDFNQLLKPGRGLVYVVDMETLPEEEPESIAITWKVAEVEEFLAAAGLPAVVSKHQKLTMVYQAQIRHQVKDVDQARMLRSIRSTLVRKLKEALIYRQEVEAATSINLEKWIVATGTIARLAEELDAIDAC